MGGLAGVRAKCRDFAPNGVGDVDDVVDALVGRGHEPELADGPRFQALVGEQLRMGERVARIGVDGGEGGLAGRAVVRVRGGEPAPPDLRRLASAPGAGGSGGSPG